MGMLYQCAVGSDESEISYECMQVCMYVCKYVCMYVHHVQTDSGAQLASCLLGQQVGMKLISQF